MSSVAFYALSILYSYTALSVTILILNSDILKNQLKCSSNLRASALEVAYSTLVPSLSIYSTNYLLNPILRSTHIIFL